MALNTLQFRLERNRTVGKVLLLVILFFILYYPVLKGMALKDWARDSNYSHGFLVPFVSAYLVWRKRGTLASLKPKPATSGLFLLVGGLLIYLLGVRGRVVFLTQISLVIVIAGLCLYLLGREYTKRLLFPLTFLLFMIKLPSILIDSIGFPLKLFASFSSAEIASLFGIPVFREGNIIQLANYTLEVADACSGLRSLIALMALGALYAYLIFEPLLKRSLLFLSSIPIALLANMVRVVILIVVAHLFGGEAANRFFHDFSGFVLFGVALFLLILTGRVLEWIDFKKATG